MVLLTYMASVSRLVLTYIASVDSLVFKTTSYKTKTKAKTLGFKAKIKTDFQDHVQELNFCKNYKTSFSRRKKMKTAIRDDGNRFINSRIGT